MNRNLWGILSFVTVIISTFFFFISRGPNADITMIVIVFTVLSILGIIFAITSKRLVFIIIGILLNAGVLIFTYFLLLAIGISGP